MHAGAFRLWVTEHGPADAPAAILVHGLASSGAVWERNIDALVRAGVRVIVPDLPGHGRSDGKRHRATYTPRFFARALLALADTMGVERFDLVGNSLGGVVAARMALAAPDRVGRLVLIDSAGLSTPAVPWKARLLYVPLALPALLGLTPPPALTRWFLKAAVLHNASLIPEVQRALSAHPPLASAVRRSAAALLGPEGSVEAELGSIGAPTLLVWGEHDVQFPVDMAEVAVRRLPQGRLKTVPNAGHIPQFEAPDAVNRLLVDFLAPSEVAAAQRMGDASLADREPALRLRPHRTLGRRSRRPSAPRPPSAPV